MNILIANHTGTQAHLGCQATSYALEQMLRRKFRPDNIWIDNWNARGSLRKAKSLLPLATDLKMRLRSPDYKFFREADLIVVNGEGMFYSPACGEPNSVPSQRLLEARLSKTILKKQLWIVNHTLYSEDKKFDALIHNLYTQADYVAVREERTLKYLQAMGLQGVRQGVRQGADAVFSLPLPPAAQQSPWKNRVLLTDSSAWPRRQLPRFREQLLAFVHELRRNGLDVAYLSIRTDRREANIAEQLGLEYFSACNIQEFLAHLQTARLVVSGRFHLNAFAILCGVPYLSFDASTNKNQALNEFIKYPLPVFNFEKHSLREINISLEKALNEHDTLQEHLSVQRTILRELAELNVTDLA